MENERNQKTPLPAPKRYELVLGKLRNAANTAYRNGNGALYQRAVCRIVILKSRIGCNWLE